MIFTTLKFLVFFILVFLLYYIVPKKLQWLVLLVASLYFYTCASVKYSVFLLIATGITYIGACLIGYYNDVRDKLSPENRKLYKDDLEKRKKNTVEISVFLTLIMLVVMKYMNFGLENISKVFNIIGFTFTSPEWNFVLPLGISFYTFTSIGYLVDVYREEYKPEKNFFKYLLFISYFPHILQGPIDKYNDVSKELFAEKKFDYDRASIGLYRIAVGVLKKMIVADNISIILSDVLVNTENYLGINVIISIVLYAIQLYSDFSGYMDIAIGCSNMLGITIAENFDAPYYSKSIAEYWRRWHISLGAWFRDYLYYPLLRSKLATNIRKYYKKENNKYMMNNMPNVFALTIFWVLIGLWHGSTWGYIFYGIYHGSIIIMSTLLNQVYNKFHEEYKFIVETKLYSLFQMGRTFCLVLIGYFLFWVGGLKQAIRLFLNIFRESTIGITVFDQTSRINFLCIAIGTIIILIMDIFTYNKIDIYKIFKKFPLIIKLAVGVAVVFLIVLIPGGTAQEFLYFQF